MSNIVFIGIGITALVGLLFIVGACFKPRDEHWTDVDACKRREYEHARMPGARAPASLNLPAGRPGMCEACKLTRRA
jgi:hypothetical protein